MLLTKKSTVRMLLCFFEHHQTEKKIIVSGDLYNLLMWDKIFLWFFVTPPRDSKPIPSHHKKGSTDPRWDLLLHEKAGLHAQTFVFKLFKRKEKYASAIEKAA